MKKLLILSLLIFAQSCDDDLDPNRDKFSTFDRKEMLQSLATNIIRPGLDSVLIELTSLEQRVQAFVASPNEATLAGAQLQWIAAARAWKRVEFFKLGLLDESLPMLAKVDVGAADPVKRTEQISSDELDQALASASAITVEYIDAQPATLQGYPVLEFLLFRNSASVVVGDYTVGANAEQRKAYLLAATQNLRQKIASLVADWAGGYVITFSSEDGRDIGSSLGMLVNDLAFLTEGIKNEKVGRPLGFRTAGVKHPEAVEARLSGQSIQFILENLTGIERAITGDNGGFPGTGLDALLDHLEAKFGDTDLSDLILQQIQVIRQKISTITTSLPDAVRSNPTVVQELYDELKKLVVLIKVDMTNNIGVMITYTDNDGD
jgi:uncharacterized protein